MTINPWAASSPEVGAALFVGWLLFIAGIVAAAIAIWGILSQRGTARRRSTIDFIFRQESDRDVIEARSNFIRLSKDPSGLAPYAAAEKETSQEVQWIRTTLNEYELLAVGIQFGIVDYPLYERWGKSSTIRFWKSAAPFIVALRERAENQMLYHEFEQLVGWLKGEKKRPKRNIWFRKIF